VSKSADQAFVDAFDDEVKHAYQGGGKLRDCVSVRNNIGAQSIQFQKLGTATMRDNARQSKFEPADVAHTKATATLTDKRVSELTDVFDDDKMNINERQELAKIFGNSMGREEDQTIYDIMDDQSYSGDQQIGTSVGSGSGEMNITKLRQAKNHFDEIEAPMSDRFFVMTPKAQMQLLSTTEVASQDYNQVKALVQGEVDTFLGFTFKTLPPSREEGGIAVNTNTANNYAFHKRSVGCAIGTGPRTDVDWNSTYASWLTQSFLSIGCAIRDDEGQVQVQSDQSQDPAQG